MCTEVLELFSCCHLCRPAHSRGCRAILRYVSGASMLLVSVVPWLCLAIPRGCGVALHVV